jgi:hypothetical protein
MKWLYRILAIANVANGLWMLAAPAGWFADLPAAVPDTGPFNSHFVRDLGVVFTVCGAGFAWCAENLDRALPVHLGITAFYAGHAATHVADILSGRLPASHWWIDMPAVFAPTVLLLCMAVALHRTPRPSALRDRGSRRSDLVERRP